MAKTYEELLEQAAIIRDETAAGKNTATRVGGTITDAVDYVKELQDTYAGIHAEAAEAKTAAAAAKTKNAEQDGKISSLEAKDATHDTKIAKLEERVLQYIYPKIYQLNEGAGAIVFHGFYKGSASVSDERKTASEEGYSYKVVFKSGSFYLQEISPEGVTVLYSSWDKISLPNNEIIESSESYAQRDCLYYIYVDGEGSTYYYIDSDGVASEKSATYLLRRLVDKNASDIATLQGKDAAQDGDIAKLHERDTAIDGKISALEAKDIEHNSAIVREATVEYYDHSVTDGPSRINTRATFKFFGADNNQLFTATLLGAGNGYPGLLSLKNKTKLDGYADTFPQNPAASSESNGLMSAADKAKVGNYPEQFVLDLGILNSQSEGEIKAAKSEVAGNRNISFIRFQVQGHDKLKTILIMQWPNGVSCTAQIMCVDKAQWRRNVTGATGVEGAPTNAYPWERTAPHKIDYDEQRRMIKLKDYENQTVSQEVELPLATSSQPGLMSSDDKTKLDCLAIDTTWAGQHANAFTEAGEFHIYGERTNANDGLPILNSGSGHTIEARLTVLDSSLTNGTGKDTDIVVTQILRLSNRTGGDGHVYVRTAQASTKSQLATPSSTAWGTWEKLMGVFEKNAVSNATDLNEYTSSGMYDGMFVFSSTSQTAVSGLKIENGSTFLMVSVNGYAVAQTGVVPQVTQLLYVMPSGLDGSSGVRNAKVYTRTGIYVASTKTYTWGKFDGLAQASDITKLLGYIQDNSDLIQENQSAITANTKEIARVNSLATQAQESADRAQEAANTAQTTADSASSAATTAQTAAETAQTTAGNAQTKNTEQDARLEKIENNVSHLFSAGRYWNEANGTPTAAGHYGNLDALRLLPERLGLGRYLVKDDRTRRKLDPKDSTKYADDGTDAKLDGTDGQCMWCWNGFYANVWKEGDNLFKVVSFDRPVGNDISIWIPAGGISWLGAGVIDRGDAPFTDKTKWKLCSVINNSEQFRGGGGQALDASTYSKAPAAESPQITMLGMPATKISTTDFGTYARKRGEGWEANWFVARFVVEFLFEVIMGTENSQEAFNANKDADGLYQGGFGLGVVDIPNWNNYNGTYPVIPTSVGLEAGDGVCIVPYNLPQTNGAEGDTYKTFNVPVFFGLVGAGFGNLYQLVRGLIMNAGEEKSLVYVAPSMYAAYDPNTVSGKIMVAECPRVSGWITRKSYKGLCCMPTEIGGSATIRFADFFYSTNGTNLLCVRAAGGRSPLGTQAGASFTYADNTAANAYLYCSAPLCYFEEDPIIPKSQSISNNN